MSKSKNKLEKSVGNGTKFGHQLKRGCYMSKPEKIPKGRTKIVPNQRNAQR